jgi:hypothetical protein
LRVVFTLKSPICSEIPQRALVSSIDDAATTEVGQHD